jgi:hypothetical protein
MIPPEEEEDSLFNCLLVRKRIIALMTAVWQAEAPL